MTTFTFESTGRTWASTKYNRTTRQWLDGGDDFYVRIHDDDSGAPLTRLSDDELLAVAGEIVNSERNDIGELADQIAAEVERRLAAIGDEIDNWDGESASWLADRLNDLELLAKRAGEALSYVPGRPHGYDFTDTDRWYDVTSLGWYCEREPSAARNDVYACDKQGVFVVVVAGTTDDGWTTEESDATPASA